MPLLSLITAVSRPQNLRAMHDAIASSWEGVPIDLSWVLVFDDPSLEWATWAPHEPSVEEVIKNSKVPIQRATYNGDHSFIGIAQRNLAIAQVRGGFIRIHDDDDILHPNFLKRIAELISSHPDKKAFAYNQQRWDRKGVLQAEPKNMRPSFVDSAQVVIHHDLIKEDTYRQKDGYGNDGHLIMRVYQRHPDKFFFHPEILCYYNYLRH